MFIGSGIKSQNSSSKLKTPPQKLGRIYDFDVELTEL